MKDKWYGDDRDLVKWAVLLGLADKFKVAHILQVLYLTPTAWQQVQIHGDGVDIPPGLVQHFRDTNSICRIQCQPTVEVFKHSFEAGGRRRLEYHDQLLETISKRVSKSGIVFLDPDTGLEPDSGRFDISHVTAAELGRIWISLRSGDVLVFYQHRDNFAGREWKDRKRLQFAGALGIPETKAKLAHAPQIGQDDVAFYFALRD